MRVIWGKEVVFSVEGLIIIWIFSKRLKRLCYCWSVVSRHTCFVITAIISDKSILLVEAALRKLWSTWLFQILLSFDIGSAILWEIVDGIGRDYFAFIFWLFVWFIGNIGIWLFIIQRKLLNRVVLWIILTKKWHVFIWGIVPDEFRLFWGRNILSFLAVTEVNFRSWFLVYWIWCIFRRITLVILHYACSDIEIFAGKVKVICSLIFSTGW